MSVSRNEVTQYIADIVAEKLKESFIEEGIAKNIGETVTDELSAAFGGQVLVMPIHESEAYSNVTNDLRLTKVKGNTEGMAGLRRDVLRFLAAATINNVKLLGYESFDLEEIAADICSEFCAKFSGQNLVIPKDLKFKKFQRNKKIWEEFNGSNHSELALRYEVSVNALYRILKKYCTRKKSI